MEVKIWNFLIYCSWNLLLFYVCLIDFGIYVYVCVWFWFVWNFNLKREVLKKGKEESFVCDWCVSWVFVCYLNKIYDNLVFYLLYLRDIEVKVRVVN